MNGARYLLLLLAFSLVACGQPAEEVAISDGRPLPRHVFEIEGRARPGASLARAMPGMQASPVPVVPGDATITKAYQDRHFQVVRVPQDDFCDYSLAGIFPNRDDAVQDPSSYEFDNIDSLVAGVRKANSEVLWQASYDIGGKERACRAAQGRHAGTPVQDADRHVRVVINVLRHFNKGTDWDPDGNDFGVRYVEYLNDPMGLGGYNPSSPEAYFEDFQVFSQGLDSALSDIGDYKQVHILAPAHRIRTVSETVPSQGTGRRQGFVLDFIEHVSANGIRLDILTVQNRFDDPFEMGVALANIRAHMDLHNMRDVPIWVTEVAPSPPLEEALRDLEVSQYSAFVGAHLVAAKIAWQESVERTFPHRGTRRYDAPLETSGAILESAFFDEDGLPRHAVLPFTAFLIVRGHPILRGSATTSDGLSLLAVRHTEEKKIWIIVANPGDGGSNSRARLAFSITDFPSSAELVKWQLAHVDVDSAPQLQFTEGGERAPADGTLSFDEMIETPTVLYYELTW
jgi:hypothetical protein